MLYSGTTMLMSGPAGWLAACFTSSSGWQNGRRAWLCPGTAFVLPLGLRRAITPEMPTRRSVARKTNSGKVRHSWRHLLTRYRMGQVSFQNWDWTTLFSVFSRSCSWLRLSEGRCADAPAGGPALRRCARPAPCAPAGCPVLPHIRPAARLQGVRAAKQSRLQSAAPALPRKIAVQALLCQLLCAGSQHRFFAAHQQHPVGQLLRQGDPPGSTTTRSSGRAPSAGCTAPVASSALFSAPTPPSTCTLQAELPPDALCQLPAALRFIPGQFFLIQLHASFSIPWQTLLFFKRLMRTSRQRVSRRCVALYHRNLSALR